MTFVVAHGSAHWTVDIGIYLGPMVVIALTLWLTDRRARRRRAEGQDGEPG